MNERELHPNRFNMVELIAVWLAAAMTAFVDYGLSRLLRSMTDQLERFHKDSLDLIDGRPDDGHWILVLIGVSCLAFALVVTLSGSLQAGRFWCISFSQLCLFASGWIFWSYSSDWFKASMFI
jgi:hypothetical protein